jgi:hypothetical protein
MSAYDDLIRLVAQLFDTTPRQKEFVKDAGFAAEAVDYSGSSLDAWYRIFAYVQPRQGEDALLKVLLAAEPTLAPLVEAYREEKARNPGRPLDDLDIQAKRAGRGIEAAGKGELPESIRATLAAAKGRLERVSAAIKTLLLYKEMHDLLQKLQVVSGSGRDLRAAAQNVADPTQGLALRRHLQRLEDLYDQTSPWLLGLDPRLQQTERDWIADLRDGINVLKAAINTEDAALALSAFDSVRAILLGATAHMDSRIFGTATSMQLGEVLEMLTVIAGAPEADDQALADIADAISAVTKLSALLLDRVMRHKLWQDADSSIEELSDLVLPNGGAIPPKATRLWSTLSQHMDILLEQNGTEQWRARMTKCVSTMQKRVETKRADYDLVLALEGYRDVALNQFVEVDIELKANCASLHGVSTPLDLLLRRL